MFTQSPLPVYKSFYPRVCIYYNIKLTDARVIIADDIGIPYGCKSPLFAIKHTLYSVSTCKINRTHIIVQTYTCSVQHIMYICVDVYTYCIHYSFILHLLLRLFLHFLFSFPPATLATVQRPFFFFPVICNAMPFAAAKLLSRRLSVRETANLLIYSSRSFCFGVRE